MTHLRQMMLEELQRHSSFQGTILCYLRLRWQISPATSTVIPTNCIPEHVGNTSLFVSRAQAGCER